MRHRTVFQAINISKTNIKEAGMGTGISKHFHAACRIMENGAEAAQESGRGRSDSQSSKIYREMRVRQGQSLGAS